MDNDIYLYPRECSQNTTPLIETIPKVGYQNDQPPEIIPIGSSDFPSYQNMIQI